MQILIYLMLFIAFHYWLTVFLIPLIPYAAPRANRLNEKPSSGAPADGGALGGGVCASISKEPMTISNRIKKYFFRSIMVLAFYNFFGKNLRLGHYSNYV